MDALASGLPLAAEHVQVLERLRQLTAWQQAQQERLKRHQREQIALLRAENDAPRGQTPPGVCFAGLRAQPPNVESLAPSPSVLHLDHPTTTTPTSSRDTDWTSPQQQVALAECGVLGEQCEDPLSSGVTLRGEALSDSGLDTGEQGSEEETQQMERCDDLRGGRGSEGGGHLQSGDRPIQPGVGG